MFMFNCGKRIIYFLIITSSVISIILYFFCYQYLSKFTHLTKLANSSPFKEKKWPRSMNSQSCKFPNPPLHNPLISKHLKFIEPITCKHIAPNWIITNETHAFIRQDIKNTTNCIFKTIIRQDDFKNIYKNTSTGEINVYKFTNESDFVKALCKNEKNINWKGYFAVPTPRKIKQRCKDSDHKLSVLIWGQDSLSKNMFIRKLPHTYDYLKNELNGITLEGYNIVGDATFANILPMFTGKTEKELPDIRTKNPYSTYADVFPFIWNQYKEMGYLTGYIEDTTRLGTFTYRHNGFKDQPADFYMRPYFISSYKGKLLRHCEGSIPRHLKAINYLKQILKVNRETPKFIFSFISELSHDSINDVQGSDPDQKKLFKHLNSTGILNNSILIVMSDHGHRFHQGIRATQDGKLEERMPMFMFIFPNWFKSKYGKAYANFIENINKLSNPFDIHNTLEDILNLNKIQDYQFDDEYPFSRGMSLFRKMSKGRNCENAEIANHWCACLKWFPLKNETLALQVANEIVRTLNTFTAPETKICARLKLAKIFNASYYAPNEDLLKFSKTLNEGLLPSFIGNTKITSMTIQLTFETTPGNAHFEVSASINMKNGETEMTIKESDVSRINKYGKQAECVDNAKLESLRKYCYCL